MERFLQAEWKLWKHYGLAVGHSTAAATNTSTTSIEEGGIQELQVQWKNNNGQNKKLLGVDHARVWELLVSVHGTTGSKSNRDQKNGSYHAHAQPQLPAQVQEQQPPVLPVVKASNKNTVIMTNTPCTCTTCTDANTTCTCTTTIVFIHGGGGTPGDFAPLLPPFAESLRQTQSSHHPHPPHHSYRILLLERPGNGASIPVDYSTTNCPDLAEFSALFVAQVLEALGLITTTNCNSKVHFVGNSMGGATSLWFAQRYPHCVASLTFLGAPVGFQGMVLPWLLCLFLRWTDNETMTMKITCLVKLLLSIVPAVILRHWFWPLIVLSICFGIPHHALLSVYLEMFGCAMAMGNNLTSFQTLLNPLWRYSKQQQQPEQPPEDECATNTTIATTTTSSSSGTAGWKLQDLQDLQDDHNIPVLFVHGKQGDPFMTTDQLVQVTNYIDNAGGVRAGDGTDVDDHHHHVVSIGQGHLPWFADPQGVADCLVRHIHHSSC